VGVRSRRFVGLSVLALLGAGPSIAGAAPKSEIARGCGVAGAPTGVQRKSLEVGGKTRTYLLSVPDGYRTGTPLPLVFGWHGLGGSGERFRDGYGLEEEAAGAAIFVYPDGLPQPSLRNRPGWDLRPDGDVRFFDALLADVQRSYCVDRGRVFSTGHSFGGYMTHTLGCLRPDLLRGIAPVAGGLTARGCGKAVPTWLAHASNDPIVAFKVGEAARDHWRSAAGCAEASRPVEPAGCVTYDRCAVPVRWCVHDQRHSWPPFASAAIWRFFDELK
jgi:polyhydroxybutyrate depolymerase